MKSKMTKAIITGVVVIVITTGGYAVYNKIFKKTVAVTATKFSSSIVKTMSISKTIQGTGAAYVGTSSNVAPNNNGTISGLTVKVGDTVTATQKLFVCTGSALTNAVTAATEKLAKANSQLATNETTLTTANSQLATDQSASKVDSNKLSSDEKTISDATSKLSDDTETVSDATTELTNAKAAVASMTVHSPIGGLVTTVVSSNGSTGKSSESSLTISDMNTMKVKVAVDELDITSVAVGQKATIKFDALADKTFTGTVESAAQSGTATNNITTYDVVVSVSSPKGIRLGMNANVTIAIQSKENAIVIPSEALIESNSKKYVRVEATTSSDSEVKNNTSEAQSNSKLVEITTGIETEDYIEVTKGVTEGQALIVQLPTSSSSTTQGGMGGMGSGGVRPSGGQMSNGGAQAGGNNSGSSSKSTTTK
ncbi:MAG TPA: efflux RND transporter periplasmic adaptor subunit [Clostridium sp.]|uniref:efflux RND transporter periplasmic adaptor subunit n=1 Tax=Clostridium sp. TaxID=1506 RepID=UPI002F957288